MQLQPGPQVGIDAKGIQKIFVPPPLEKCVGHSLKNLGPSLKTLRPSWCLKLVTGVAVDCIALNYSGKHKRKMVIRGISSRPPSVIG